MARRKQRESEPGSLQKMPLSVFKEALEDSSDAIGMSTPQGRHYYQNKAFTDLFGIIGENPPATLYCDEKIGIEVFQTIMSGGTWTGEVAMYAKDRRILNIWLRAYAIKDEKGRVIGLAGIHTDITERRLAESALRESQAKFKGVFDFAADALHLIEDGRFIENNESAIRMYGFENKEEMLGKTPMDLSPERQPDGQLSSRKIAAYIQKAMAGEPQRFYWLHKRYDTGECFDVEVYLSGIVLKGKQYLLASGRNITERRRTEDALKLSEATYREIFNNVNDTIWVHDIDTFEFIDVNNHVSEMFGYQAKEALSLSVEDISSGIPPFTKETAAILLGKARVGEPQLFEWHTRHKDGHLFWTEVNLKRGTIAGRDCILAIERDITERKTAEGALRASEHNYREVFNGVTNGIFVHDARTGAILDANSAILEMLGYTREEALRLNAGDFSQGEPPYTEADALWWVQRSVHEGPQTFEWLAKRKSGELFWIEVNLKTNVIGGQDRVLAVVRDISERKRIEAALRENEERLRLALAGTNQGLYDLNLQTGEAVVSPEYLRMLGYKPGEIVVDACWWSNQVHPDDLAMTSRTMQDCVQGRSAEYRMEYRLKNKGGDWTWVLSLGRVVAADQQGRPIRMLGTHTDITERKEFEDALIQERELTNTLVQSSPAFFVAIDADGKTRMMNQSMLDALGYRVDEVAGTDYLKTFVPEADHAALTQVFQLLCTSNQPTLNENRVLTKDGRELLVEWHGRPVFKAEVLDYFFGVGIDITGRRRAEAALRASEALYHDMVETSQDLIWQCDAEGRYTYLNPAWEQVLGYRLDEMLGRPFTDFQSMEQAQLDRELFGRLLAGESVKGHESFHLRKDGKEVCLVFNAKLVCGPDQCPAGTRGTAYDITERKQAEEKLRQMHAIESLGTVAGGIAHDFNNLLTGVFGNIELAKTELPQNHPAIASLQAAHQALENARQLTTRLLTFARGGNPVMETIDLRQRIRETVQFHLSGSNVSTHYDIPMDLWPVTADKGQITEIISNLTINAKEAMPAGGTLYIHARNIPAVQETTSHDLSGDCVKLTFRDEGIGIHGNIMGKIFDPYFTTKKAGSGLGLAIVHGIIKRHKGHISVESIPGAGSTFNVFLPADTTAQATPETEIPSAAVAPVLVSKRILLMDDDVMIRNTTSSMLEMLGCTVDTAVNGRDTIGKYAAALNQGSPFDLTIMDLTIPGGMGGKEAIGEILALNPFAKVVVSSGYSSDPVLADYTAYGFSGRLAKPFTFQELYEVISDIFQMQRPPRDLDESKRPGS